MSGNGAESEAALPLWRWSGTREPAGDVETLAVRVELFAVAHEDGTRTLRLRVEIQPGRRTFWRRRVVWSPTMSWCNVTLGVEQVRLLHQALSQWLQVPVPSSRLPSPRGERDTQGGAE